MNKRITEVFAKGKAFIPFVTCGDPSLEAFITSCMSPHSHLQIKYGEMESK